MQPAIANDVGRFRGAGVSGSRPPDAGRGALPAAQQYRPPANELPEPALCHRPDGPNESNHGLNAGMSGQGAWNAWISQKLAIQATDPAQLGLDQPPHP
jgi:hypothetical protein